jgi:hypothetical protein
VSRSNFSTASDEELKRTLEAAGMGSPARTDALAELQRRQTERLLGHVSTPHWTITPLFIVAVLTLVFAAIAAWPVVRDWLPHHTETALTSEPTTPTPTASP